MLRRELHELLALADATPQDAPLGLTDFEIGVLEGSFSRIVNAETTLMGRRIVRIPWDWERDW